jgi:hypothetical protein
MNQGKGDQGNAEKSWQQQTQALKNKGEHGSIDSAIDTVQVPVNTVLALSWQAPC